ncbi:ArsR/SmtB family transcription factor [Cellulomonas iranensis]|uniref:DNA-binding transcriptional ArsR family regulator n=1 Tax=Cellulomonas iranensis TaxID=76862 RepID=A0ABU0GGF4_9CELL|nr:winged helix-turn-helix domain-containing protein [Cellulomonas iranensis]MDQ0424442.1 DNA-binding transcriptional ArsR family regulator [Cellulomonas iranensis]
MDDLLARVATLEERVAALEAAPTTTTPPLDTDADDRFWALTGLTARVDRPASSGAVMMVGDVRTPAGDEARWQYALTTDHLLAADWSDLAPVLAALGHPVRLALLRAVLDGARTARELADAVDVGSTGQVYHHLRQLQAAGWLRAAAGGEHVVPAERLVPLLTTLLAAVR